MLSKVLKPKFFKSFKVPGAEKITNILFPNMAFAVFSVKKTY